MRTVFYLFMALLVLKMFFPAIAEKLESAALAFLDLANVIFTSAAASTGPPVF
jgi:hypothetical protein